MTEEETGEGAGNAQPEYDKVTQASLNGIYVKAQELDRGHNVTAAPVFAPPGLSADIESHASDAYDAQARASDASAHASDASAHVSDVETHASDAQTHASDAEAHASDARTHASERDA